MRISDWSSDVCSSDLGIGQIRKRDRSGGIFSIICLACTAAWAGRMRSLWLAPCAVSTKPERTGAIFTASCSSPNSASISRRSEEHTSELQTLMRNSYAVFCLKKNTNMNRPQKNTHNRQTSPTPHTERHTLKHEK